MFLLVFVLDYKPCHVHFNIDVYIRLVWYRLHFANVNLWLLPWGGCSSLQHAPLKFVVNSTQFGFTTPFRVFSVPYYLELGAMHNHLGHGDVE